MKEGAPPFCLFLFPLWREGDNTLRCVWDDNVETKWREGKNWKEWVFYFKKLFFSFFSPLLFLFFILFFKYKIHWPFCPRIYFCNTLCLFFPREGKKKNFERICIYSFKSNQKKGFAWLALFFYCVMLFFYNANLFLKDVGTHYFLCFLYLISSCFFLCFSIWKQRKMMVDKKKKNEKKEKIVAHTEGLSMSLFLSFFFC